MDVGLSWSCQKIRVNMEVKDPVLTGPDATLDPNPLEGSDPNPLEGSGVSNPMVLRDQSGCERSVWGGSWDL